MAQTPEPKRTQPPDPAHYAESSARENLIDHVFLGELLRGLWRKNIRDLEVLRPEVDNGGYDLALEFRGLTRHVQLKSSYQGARRADVTASVKLLERPSACILWIFFEPETLSLGPFLWFGGAPGERMPALGETIARHTKPMGCCKRPVVRRTASLPRADSRRARQLKTSFRSLSGSDRGRPLMNCLCGRPIERLMPFCSGSRLTIPGHRGSFGAAF